MEISSVVHTRNSEATLEKALSSLAWTDEIVVVDMESDDATQEIARRFTGRIIKTAPAPRVDGIRNRFLEEARHRWILVLDSDEYLAVDAEPALRRLLRTEGEAYDAFALPRYNYIAGQVMRGSGWYPDHQTRLFRRGTVRWTDGHHHPPEVVTGEHRLKKLDPPQCPHIHHQNYRDLGHFLEKQLLYARSENYSGDPEAFHFEEALIQANRQLAMKHDPDADGDLSTALSLVMAWDEIIRGLLHWDSLEPRPPLRFDQAIPLAAGSRPGWRAHLASWRRRLGPGRLRRGWPLKGLLERFGI